MKRLIVSALAVALVVLAPRLSDAAIIELGTLNIDGDFKVTASEIIWLPAGPAVDTDATGLADVGDSTGIFDGLECSDCAIQKNLSLAGQPAGVDDLNFLNFETYTNAPTLNFTLDRIELCDPAFCATGFENTPFNFVTTFGNTSVIVNMEGTMDWGALGLDDLAWTGQWTAQFPGQTTEELIAQIVGAPGFIATTFSASKITVEDVPEPALLLTFGAGLSALGVRMRRRREATKA